MDKYSLIFWLAIFILTYFSENVQPQRFVCSHGKLFDRSVTTTVGNIVLNTNHANLIGSGGFGKIYHAYWPNQSQPGLSRCVAVKISGVEMSIKRKAVTNELNILSNFSGIEESQSHIIKIYGSEQDQVNKDMYVVMELGGQTLDVYFDANKDNHQHNIHEFVQNILRATALAIQQFHNAGGIHLDIKADNFILALNHDQSEVQVDPLKCKLIDFNTSLFLSNINEAKLSLATEDYMAPEIRSKLFKSKRNDNLSQKVDIWAFGLMGYELLYGELPEGYKKIDKTLKEYRASAGQNTLLDHIIKRCINKDPNQRPSIDDILRSLNL